MSSFEKRTVRLRPIEREIIEAMGRSLIPEGGGIPYSGADVDLIGFFGKFLADLPKPASIGVRIGLRLVQHYAVLKKFRRFTHLSPQGRDAVLESMRMSRIYAIRGIYVGLNTPFQMCFYADKRVMEHIGYFGDQPGQQKIGGAQPQRMSEESPC